MGNRRIKSPKLLSINSAPTLIDGMGFLRRMLFWNMDFNTGTDILEWFCTNLRWWCGADDDNDADDEIDGTEELIMSSIGCDDIDNVFDASVVLVALVVLVLVVCCTSILSGRIWTVEDHTILLSRPSKNKVVGVDVDVGRTANDDESFLLVLQLLLLLSLKFFFLLLLS